MMKRLTFLLLSFATTFATGYAQKGISYSHHYAAGRKLLMCVDSSAKNVFYANKFPNQPDISFSYLPEVSNVSVQVYFDKTDRVEDYRYTILEDNEPIVVNKSVNKAELKEIEMPEQRRFTRLGLFSLKGKNVTTLLYNVKKPLNVYKSIFYGKPIPKAIIKGFSKHTVNGDKHSYSWFTELKEKTALTFGEKDRELTIIKDRSDIDYVYHTEIRDKQTGKVMFESSVWRYDGIIDENEFLPYITVEKEVFQKSGEYEIIIQPKIKWDLTSEEIEKYTTRHTLSVTVDEERYTKKELFLYVFIAAFSIGSALLIMLYFSKKRNRKKLEEKEQQKDIAKLQLGSIRSQLNPHFLFNALSGIQNLMNKNETDNANKYLSKFARLTRNVLNDKELISLSQEKTLLDDYLQMEQLRFGFKYEINSSAHLDSDNIEIPSMLLQPFVENAVKHGISQKAADGKITISFTRQENDLMLTVADNGKGFDTEKKGKEGAHNGLGLSLSNSRIALLNSIYKKNRFTLAIQSNAEGTKISLTLSEWL